MTVETVGQDAQLRFYSKDIKKFSAEEWYDSVYTLWCSLSPLCPKRLEKWSLLQLSMPEMTIPWTKMSQPNFSAVDRFRYISEVEPTIVTGGLHTGMMAKKESEMLLIK